LYSEIIKQGKKRSGAYGMSRLNTPQLILWKIRAKVLRDWYVVQMDEEESTNLLKVS
jgi:hypothetical protein